MADSPTITDTAPDRLHAEDLARCVHCGFCLQACPTYVITGLETESPRGRIQLARALAEDNIEVTPKLTAHFDLCLGCRACETACPSGVPYGRIIEGARAVVQKSAGAPLKGRFQLFLLRQVLISLWRLRFLFSLLRLYQMSSLSRLIAKILPRRVREIEKLLPRLRRQFFEVPEATIVTAEPPKATTALLNGCVMPLIYPQTHSASIRVLTRNGMSVIVPKDQGCCGALLVHAGDPEAARKLARRNIDTFLESGVDYIVVDSAGCGSAMKEYTDLFAAEPAYADKATTFAAKVKDVTELLVQVGFEKPEVAVEAKVTYQDSCHLAHAQGIRDAPREILRSIPGVQLTELKNPDRCCGSAGIYNLTQPEMSRQVLDEKMADARATGCEVIATANPGCMMQLELGVSLHQTDQEVVHVVEMLDLAYEAKP